jgi:hypothetical protein
LKDKLMEDFNFTKLYFNIWKSNGFT